MVIDRHRIKTDPDYLAKVITTIESKEDFKKLIPFLNTPIAAKSLLTNANLKILKYCQETKIKTNNNLFPNEEINLLSQIIYLYLRDTNYLSSKLTLAEKITSIYNLYPQEVLGGIDRLLQSENAYSKSYFEQENAYIPLLSLTNIRASDKTDSNQVISSANEIANNYLCIKSDLQTIIDDRFPGAKLKDLNSKEIDIIKIIMFFNNVPLVESQLYKLESALIQQAGERYDSNSKKLKDYQEGRYLKHNKLLTEFLKSWAIENNFKGWAKLSSALNAEQFYTMLGNHTIFKDKTFRTSRHGEFSHAIQLYCLMEYNNECEKKGEQFLVNKPIDLLKWTAEEPNIGLAGKWDNTFDYNDPKYKRVRTDFTQPEYLNDYLLGGGILNYDNDNAIKFPLLRQLILGRMQYKPSTSQDKRDANSYEIKPLSKK